MHEREDKPKDNFVMSGQPSPGTEREEAYDFAAGPEEAGKKSLKPILIAGAGLLVAVIVVLMFVSGSPRSADRDQVKNLEGRVKQLEEKLAKLEWIDTGMARLDRREKDLAALAERLNQTEAGLSRKIDQIGKEAAKPPAKAAEAPAPKSETPPAKTAAAPAKAEKDAKAKAHEVQKGETLYGISRRYGMSVDQILKLNNLTLKEPIKVGQKILIAP
jgi:LysM repeat protein